MKGYITILATLILLAVTGGIATALLFSSTDTIQAQEVLRQGDQALLFSESCLEDGLLQITRNPDYKGSNFEMPQGHCEVAVEKNDTNYIVQAIGKNAKFERKVIAEVSLDLTGLKINSWREE
jgi:hypothetical protein